MKWKDSPEFRRERRVGLVLGYGEGAACEVVSRNPPLGTSADPLLQTTRRPGRGAGSTPSPKGGQIGGCPFPFTRTPFPYWL